MEKYNPKKIEKKWQDKWEEQGIYRAEDGSEKPKKYILLEFPYPSGAGLHVGHCRSYSALDTFARKKRVEGGNVLFPMGWDAFGLPTENFAIKNKIHPRKATEQNIANFKKQIKSLGLSFDWSREINTTDPKYYKWTQWIFLKLFEKGLAYQAEMPINWCPSCKIGLANEEVVDGKCERCGSQTEKQIKKQWMLKITAYADRLIKDLEKVDYPERVKTQQINWIGKSCGAEVEFKLNAKTLNAKRYLNVFTTRPDTLFGCTYMVVCPEHEMIRNYELGILNFEEVEKYVKESRKKSDLERTDLAKEKTGVEIKGIKAINPVNNKEIPIFVADYVLPHYGTGAIMAVPRHDARDWEFSNIYKLPALWVIKPNEADEKLLKKIGHHHQYFIARGTLINSGKFSGMKSREAEKKIIKWLEEKGFGKKAVNYKLRDWIFSRQHYWGEPIPLVFCENCKNKKYNYILLHGTNGNSQSCFLPWLKKELEKQGHNVFCPNLPNPNKPNIDKQVNYILKNTKINQDTVFVSWSLAGAITMRLLEKTNKKVAKVLFVDSFIKPEFNDRKRPKVIKSCDWQFDFEKIKKLSDEFIVLADSEFSVIPKKQSEQMEKLFNAKLLFKKPNDGHFCDIIEPEILEQLKNTGIISIPEKDLPVELPFVKKYEPTKTGESPLANISKWVNVKCPKCGCKAKRETDTMPNWAGSSWYYLRYLDPKNDKAPADFEKIKYWMPVDFYNGGMEHTTLHLLYSRFWHKFLFDIGVVSQDEPYKKRTSHGMVLAEDGRKMSKSLGNVINPDDVVKKFGADALRLYEMFMGPFEQAVNWSKQGVVGMQRFLEKVWKMKLKVCKVKSNTKTKILLATNNKGKLKELRDHLKNFNILSLKDTNKKIEEPEEDGKTFAENSLIKTKYYAKKTSYLTIGDDSGLCVNALSGRPGVFSSRYAQGDYKKAHQKLFRELENKKDRSAYFQAVITLYNPKNNKYEQFNGKCKGEILNKSRGNSGFGYDPVFMPDGLEKSFGECSSKEKYKYDHRKKAVDKLIEYLNEDQNENLEIERLLHQTIKKVTEDIDNFKFNTAISQLMILTNETEKQKEISKIHYSLFLILLSPFAPHLSEEIWHQSGNKNSIFKEKWPKYDSKLIKEEKINLIIQINGKFRGKIETEINISEDEAKKISLKQEKIKKWTKGKKIKKIIFVPKKLINIVI